MIQQRTSRRLVHAPLVILSTLFFLGSSTPSDEQPRFLLRAVDGAFSFLPTAGPNNVSNCIVVLPDGRFYLALKRQEFMDGNATLKKFEGALDPKALRILQGILDQESIKNASQFRDPHSSFPVDGYEFFEADIQRNSTVQRVGYVNWQMRLDTNSAPKEPNESEIGLHSLVEWFRTIKSSKVPLKRPTSKWANVSCDLGNDVK